MYTQQWCIIAIIQFSPNHLLLPSGRIQTSKALRSEQITETFSLYMDNMLLYLEDASPSLSAALQLIQRFGKFSGLQINWAKCQILLLDINASTAEQAALPLMRAIQIRYLGIQVSCSLTDYINLNLEPLYAVLKNKTQTFFSGPTHELWNAFSWWKWYYYLTQQNNAPLHTSLDLNWTPKHCGSCRTIMMIIKAIIMFIMKMLLITLLQ